MANNESEPMPIELLTTDELVDELKRRHLAVVVVTISECKNEPDETEHAMYTKGGSSLTLGMATLACERIKARFLAPPTESE